MADRHSTGSRPVFQTLLAMLAWGLLLSPPAWSQTSLDWLGDAVHPRDLAMANAAVAATGACGALDLNPAGLEPGFQTAMTSYPAGIRQQLVQYVHQKDGRLSAFEIRRFNYGTFDGYDADRVSQGEYTAADMLVRYGVKRRAGKILSIGAAGGLLSSRLEKATAWALTWSLGAQLEITRLDARLGVVLQNRGLFLTHFGKAWEDELPAVWLAGVSKTLAHLPFTFHIAAGNNIATSDLLWRLGGEFHLPRGLSLRLGVDQGKLDYHGRNATADLFSGFSLGFGVRTAAPARGIRWDLTRLQKVGFDFAIKSLGPLGYATSFSLGLII